LPSANAAHLCKVNYYKTSTRNVKNEATGQGKKQPVYQIETSFPMGTEKSVFMIEFFFKLKAAEAMAIRWHMGGFDDAVRGGSFSIAGPSNAIRCRQLSLATFRPPIDRMQNAKIKEERTWRPTPISVPVRKGRLPRAGLMERAARFNIFDGACSRCACSRWARLWA
jgi:hypothetical protein